MNAYHNLAGWLRDVKAALADAQSGNVNPMSGAYLAQLNDLSADVALMFDDEESVDVDDDDGDDEPDADELEPADADDGVVVQRPRVSSGTRSHGGRPVSGSMRALGRAPGGELQVPHPVPEAQLRRESSRATLARAKQRVKPTVPRGTPAKGVKSRGKKS